MSGPSPNIAALIAEASRIQFANRVITSGAVLVFYDYAVTFSTEISEIWNSKFTAAQALFFLTRYSFLIFTVSYCARSFIQNQSETLCRVLYFNSAAWQIMPQFGLYSILTMRTYAIYQRNQYILVILGSIAVVALGIAVYLGFFANAEVVSSDFGGTCAANPPSTFPRLHPTVQLASVVLSLFIDVLVFTLTFARTIRHTIEMRQVGLGNCLSYFILRDGALCFLSKLLIGIVGTTIFSIPASESVETWINVVNSISNPLTIILITRLVLNLRQVSHVQEGNAPTLGTISTMQEPEFAINSFLQNIVASSRLGPDDDDGDGGHEIELISVDNEAEVVEEHGVVVNHSEIIELPCDPSDV